MPATLLIVASDLLFQSRIEAAARALKVQAMTAAGLQAFRDLLADSPAGLVIDLHETSLPPLDAIAAARAAGVPVLAFGRHTDPQTLRAAREAGAQTVVPRSRLVEELPGLLRDLLAGALPR